MSYELRDKDIKLYPHFDKLLRESELLEIVTDPEKVRQNAFFPFIQYEKTYQPFRDISERPARKRRLIRYASRRDAAIFAAYRHTLAERYEEWLRAAGIADVPIAYRKILVRDGAAAGKCNIDFARDVFDEILHLRNCVVVTLDIASYFECIDHKRLKRIWCDLLGQPRLPPDHWAVFRAVTKYSYVNRDEVYERLGYIGQKVDRHGNVRRGYVKKRKQMPKQLCSTVDFRNKIAGGDPTYPSLVHRHDKPYGIPQGAPISDLLANAYLLEFDVKVANYARGHGGRYWRYSDDIILILPGAAVEGETARQFVSRELPTFGDKLFIKESKTSIAVFRETNDGALEFSLAFGRQGRNGLEYLGFRFDGRKVYLRDSTVANFYRKITRYARVEARRHAARFNGKSLDWLLEHFNFCSFEQKYGRVTNFDELAGKRHWTFWTYANRAARAFGRRGDRLIRQVSRYRQYVRRTVREELRRRITPTIS